MGDTLWMTDEVRRWLADRCISDPPLARRTAQAEAEVQNGDVLLMGQQLFRVTM